MSITCVDFQTIKRLAGYDPGLTEFLGDVEQDPSVGLPHFCNSVLSYIAIAQHQAVLQKQGVHKLLSSIRAAVAEFHPHFQTGHYRHTLGRIGLRAITSAWAMAMYPKATHELVLTLVEGEGDKVQVMLVYL